MSQGIDRTKKITTKAWPPCTRQQRWLGPALGLVLFASNTHTARAEANARQQMPGNRLDDALLHPGLRGAKVGLRVQRLDTGAIAYEHQAHQLFVPASNVKLITTAAALSELGPDYQFKTDFFGQKNADADIDGDLTIKGYGDPYLLPERLSYLAARLRLLGVQVIKGDLVLDDSYFADDTRMAQGFLEDRTSNAYMAPSGALSAGFNAVMVHVMPAKDVALPAHVMLDPVQQYATIAGTVRTVTSGPSRINVEVLPKGAKSQVHITGHIAKDDPGRAYWRRIDNPPLFFGEVMRHALSLAGIALTGKVRVGRANDNSPLLLTALSPRLAELLGPLNKYSNNFMAMQVALVLGANRFGGPATWEKAVRALHDFMSDKVGVAEKDYVLGNASGLHSVNKLTPAQLCALLACMYHEPRVGPEFVTSLAVAAGSGTLQDRMMAGPAAHVLRAKTGTLAKASALSGYVTTAQGVPLAFSMLVNDYRHIAMVWQAQDAVAEAIASLTFAATKDAAKSLSSVAEDAGASL